jgi:tripartite-type tricarboxylate transporter receptor subunit TctC
MVSWTLVRVAAPAFVMVALSAPAVADPVADFYKGKQLTVIVGSASGGDYDMWARMISRHFVRYIPGNPEAIVQNMPGAGGIRATNFTFNVSPRDGTVVAMTSRNAPFKALSGDKMVRFDPTKMNWIGSPEVTNRVCIATATSPVKEAKDIFTKELIVAGSGQGSALSTIPPMLNRLLGTRIKLIEGYKSATDAKLAVDRGEVHGLCQSYTQVSRSYADELASGKVRVLFTMEETPIPGVDAPSIYKFTTDEKQRQVLSLFSVGVVLGRPMYAPPDVPADRVAALRRAYAQALSDPELNAEAKKQGLVVTHTSGEEIARIVANLMKTPPEIRELAGNLGD